MIEESFTETLFAVFHNNHPPAQPKPYVVNYRFAVTGNSGEAKPVCPVV